MMALIISAPSPYRYFMDSDELKAHYSEIHAADKEISVFDRSKVALLSSL